MVFNSYQTTANDRLFTVVDDLTLVTQVLLHGRLLSAGFGAAPAGFQVSVDRPDIHVKTLPEGFYCLSARVAAVFPDLDTTPYNLAVTFSAPNHAPSTQNVVVPAQSTFPLPPLDVALSYLPVRLAGRVILAVDASPVADADITVLDTNRFLLRTPLHFAHNTGIVVRDVNLTEVAPARQLVGAVSPGSNEVTLDNGAGLAAGHILRLGAADRYELLVIDGPGSAANSFVLRGALQRHHTDGAPARRVNAAVGGASETLTADMDAGQALLPLSGPLGAPPAPTAVRIDATNPLEQEFHVLDARADADGFYSVDGVAGAVTLTLRATNPGATREAERTWRIDPYRPVNTVHFRLTTP